ncbi:MAG: LTA synthase family protein [Bacillota bacterium]|nr:LTA synthase family protein [Bacillota bacterium]
MNFRKIILNKVYFSADILLFVFIISIKMLQYDKYINPAGHTFKYLFPPIAASVFVIVGISLIFKRRTRYKVLLGADIAISIILFADTVYFGYFKDIISAGAIRNSFLIKDVSASVTSLIRPVFFLYFIDILILIPLSIFYKKHLKDNSRIRLRAAMSIIVILISVSMDAGYFNKLAKDQPNLFETMSNKLYIAEILGNVNYHAADAYSYIVTSLGKSKLPEGREKDIKTFLTGMDTQNEPKMKGVGEGKNLIMIQVEALQQFVINKSVNGQEITPNLNKFINRSLYFDNFYYQVAEGNTSDAEFMVNNSLYPAASGAAYYRYANDTLDSLPSKFNSVGYYTSVMHGNSEGFWNRNVMYKTMKFDDFYGEKSFDMSERIGLGLSDKAFLNQAITKMDTFKQPFYNFMITLSSHHPFDGGGAFGSYDVGDMKGTLLGSYLQAIHYTDAQLGTFFDELEKKGYLDNSIIILYGDHYAMPKQSEKDLYKFLGESNASDFTWFQYQKVPFLIHFPGDKNKGTDHTVAGQMDVLPTISNMFNINQNNYFGRDMLNVGNRFLIFRNGSFINGKYLYISSNNTYYDENTGEKVEEDDKLKAIRDEAQLELSYSDNILDHNLLKDLDEN